MPSRRDDLAEPLHLVFDQTPEIFATDAAGAFLHPLTVDGRGAIGTGRHDEIRLLTSIWYPSSRRSIDLDRTYVEVRTLVGTGEEHWMKLSEVEPVVPAYGGGDSFDGWIVLPVLAPVTAFALFGAGFEARSRIQIRGSAYFVA